MSRAEVKLPIGALARGHEGKFSGIDHVFRTAAEDVLRKFALYDDQNGAEIMAKIFQRSNFGYSPERGFDPRRNQGASWSQRATGGTGLGDSYGVGPRPNTGPV